MLLKWRSVCLSVCLPACLILAEGRSDWFVCNFVHVFQGASKETGDEEIIPSSQNVEPEEWDDDDKKRMEVSL